MTQRTAARLAWSIWGLTMLLSAAAAVLILLTRDEAVDIGFGFRGFTIFFALISASLGALIASKQPKNPIGWLLLVVTGLGSGIQAFCFEYGSYSLVAQRADLPGALFLGWLQNWIWIPGAGTVATVVLLLFPTGRVPSPRWRPVLWFDIFALTFMSLFNAVLAGTMQNFPVAENPYGIDSPIVEAASGFGFLLLMIGALASAASILSRFRGSRGDERQQLRAITFAAVILVLTLSASFTGGIFKGNSYAASKPMALIVIAGFVFFLLTLTVAVLKFRLYDVDVVINKTVVYGLLATFTTVVYVAIVVGFGTLIGRTGSALLSAVAAAVVALAFQPARSRVQHFANRLVYGNRATPYEVLSQLSDQLAEVYSMEDVLPRTARLIVEGTGATHAEIWLRAGSDLRPASAWPVVAGHRAAMPLAGDDLPSFTGDVAFPVRHQGELIGAVSVGTPPNEPLNPAQEKLIQDLASQAGLVLRNVALISELRASRQRLVAAQDEERRKLERNIHDGAQQQLVALTVKLRLVDSLTEKDPAKARELLASVQTEAAAAIDTLRDLARGIYPPLLADKGLYAALDAQASKASFPIEVRGEGIRRYSQETEAAAYFCCLEALQNIAKYANARAVSVTLSESDGKVAFSVSDDGDGFEPASTPRGSGLQNMTDRLDALGGHLEIDSSPGRGTTISGSLPAQALEPAS